MLSTSFSSARIMAPSMFSTSRVMAQKVTSGMAFITIEAIFKNSRFIRPRKSLTRCRSPPLSRRVAAAPVRMAKKMIWSISMLVKAPTKLVGTILTMESSMDSSVVSAE